VVHAAQQQTRLREDHRAHEQILAIGNRVVDDAIGDGRLLRVVVALDLPRPAFRSGSRPPLLLEGEAEVFGHLGGNYEDSTVASPVNCGSWKQRKRGTDAGPGSGEPTFPGPAVPHPLRQILPTSCLE